MHAGEVRGIWPRTHSFGRIYGRLFGHDRVAGGRVDTFRTIARGIAFSAFFALVFGSAQPVAASSQFPSQSEAFARCQADMAVQAQHHTITLACVQMTPVDIGTGIPPVLGGYELDVNGGQYGIYRYFSTTVPPTNPCTSMPAYPHFDFAGKATEGMQTSYSTTDPSTGAKVRCGYTMHVISPATANQWGNFHTLVSLTPTGNPAGGAGTDGKFFNPDGGVPDPPPPDSAVPATYPTTPTDAPQVCGAGTCYDPNTDTFKFTDEVSGKSVSVPGAQARSASGGCASSGSSALCAGSPNPPSLPANSPITDPATQIRSSDTTVQANPTTGQNQNVGTVVYAIPGAGTSNGQKPGDTGPASSSTAPSNNNGSYGGGADCNAPPACSGDTVMCGVAVQTWRSGCMGKAGLDQLHKDIAGDSTPPDSGHVDSTAVWQDQQSIGDPVADAANQGSYDMSGFGFSTACPMTDLTVPLGAVGTFPIGFSAMCKYGDWMRAIVIAFAIFGAAIITGGGLK